MSITKSADLEGLIRSLSALEISALQDRLKKEEADRKEEVKDTYGADFCNIVGIDKIYSLSRVEAKDLDLEHDSKYPSGVVKPSMLGDHSAVRGTMGSNRPFIAIKIEVLDPHTKQQLHVAVELIFKCYSLDGDGAKGKWMENNYVTALYAMPEHGNALQSFLYNTGGMSKEQKAAIQGLLDGQTIKSQTSDHLIRMASIQNLGESKA